MLTVVVRNSCNSRPSGRQFSFWKHENVQGDVLGHCGVLLLYIKSSNVTHQKPPVVLQRLSRPEHNQNKYEINGIGIELI